jgi:hypothetical protein
VLTVSGGTVVVGTGTVLGGAGNGTIRLPVGTALQLASDFTYAGGGPVLDFAGLGAGITVSGPGTLIVAGANPTLVLGTDTIATALSVQSTLQVQAPSVVNAAVDVAAGGLLRLISSDQATPAALTVTGGLTNAGTVEMADGTSGASASLTVSGGTLTNTGTLSSVAAWGGRRQPRHHRHQLPAVDRWTVDLAVRRHRHRNR